MVNRYSPIEREAISKYREIWKYSYSLSDMKRISDNKSVIRLYHGCPYIYGKSIVESGPNIPYSVFSLARRVAVAYGLNWSQFKHYAYRQHEVVSELSSAPAPVAARWAFTAPQGEVLSELNAVARMLVESNRISRIRPISVNDAYDYLVKEAQRSAAARGSYVTNYTNPDELNLPNKFMPADSEGCIVEINIRQGALDNSNVFIHSTRSMYNAIINKEYYYGSPLRMVIDYNTTYVDVRLTKNMIISSNVVVRGLFREHYNALENLGTEHDMSHVIVDGSRLLR
jgi:hypothetical protein